MKELRFALADQGSHPQLTADLAKHRPPGFLTRNRNRQGALRLEAASTPTEDPHPIMGVVGMSEKI